MSAFGLENPFPLGFVIGILASLLGAAVDLFYSRRKRRTPSTGGFLLLVGGGINTIVGAISILISVLLTGSIRTALVLGLGVLAGFSLGFLTVAIISIFSGKPDKPADHQG